MAEKKRKRREMGKWGLWNFFASEESMRPYLPPMKIFTKASLTSYLSNYGVVFIKPDYGWGGRGITKVWKTNGGYSFIKEKGQVVSCASLDTLYNKIKRNCRSRATYVIQKGINLARINSRPYDIRLMMMRYKGKWKYVGMLAKVAGPNSIVTNLARGKGYVTEVEHALKKSLRLEKSQMEVLQKEMIQLGHKTCKRFDQYLKYWQIGLDLAVDQDGKLWLIEENTGPAQSLFAKLKDKTAYRKMREISAIRKRRKQLKQPQR
ncbi:YheC/YheD family protein [Aneurinibacillus terranovensis]|uniref:YheC/YheD family protein n=1 Tax=Aneurinibacillus terranovensis TaxID=278991 RepID=UPI0003F53614|nr:YheC/YheD family protein [Aneurinibacillus terranovensis]